MIYQISDWIVCSVNPGDPSWIDLPAAQHGRVSFGGWLRIRGIEYWMIDAAEGSWI